MVTGRRHSDSAVTVLDMGYTSTTLLISDLISVYDILSFVLVAKKVPRHVSGIKASQRNCGITALGQYLYSGHVKLFSCCVLFTMRPFRGNKY